MKKSMLLAISILSITNCFSMDKDDKHPIGGKWGLIKDSDIIDKSREEVSKFKNNLNLSFKKVVKSYTYNPGDLVELSLTKVGQNKLTKDSGWPLDNVYDQSTLGSCTANAVALTIRFNTILASKDPTKVLNNPEMLSVSRLFHYYNTRELEGELNGYPKNVLEDNGATIYGSVLTSKLFGFIKESSEEVSYTSSDKDLFGTLSYFYWPYDPKTFSTTPSPLSYVESINEDFMNSPYSGLRRKFRFKELDDQFKTEKSTTNDQMIKFRDSIVSELAKNRPIDFGISLDENNFNFDKNGFFKVPGNIDINTYMNNRFKPNAGHAMVIVGYGPYKKINGIDPKDNSNYYKAYTSWGKFGDPKSPGAIYFQEGYINNIAKAGTEAISIWLENTQSQEQPVQPTKPKFAQNGTLSERITATFKDESYFSKEEGSKLDAWYDSQKSFYESSKLFSGLTNSFNTSFLSYNTTLESYLNAAKPIFGLPNKIFDINNSKTTNSIVNNWQQ